MHNNPALSGVQKLNYLRAQLQGGALCVISGLPLTNESYNDSVTLLQDRYGQPHKLISAHMKALIDMSGPTNSLDSLQLFYDAIETHTRSLTSLGKPTSEYGAMLVTSIMGKLPMDIRRNLARAHGTDEWTFVDLRKAIHSEIHILEMGTSDVTKYHQSGYPPTATFLTNTDRKTQHGHGITEQKVSTPNCVYCHGTHAPANCLTVKDPKQRLDIARQHKLCFNCLGRHRVSQCNSKHRCRICTRKHHTSLCADTEKPPDKSTTGNMSRLLEQPPNSSGNTSVKPPINATTANTNASLTTLSSPNTQHSMVSHTNKICLLKTAVVTVSSSHAEAKTNILFDEGSQRSFLTSDLADALSLHPTKQEDICISTFGANNPISQKLDVASIKLKTRSGRYVPLSVLIVPSIAVPLTHTVNTEVVQLPYLRELPLAHPVTSNENFKISLLIGVDHYWDIVEDDIIRGNGPTAMNSKLGYLLSGPLPVAKSQSEITSTFHIGITDDVTCDLEKFWTLETTGTEPHKDSVLSTNQQFLKHYSKNSITQLNDKSYCAKLPWKEHHPPLPSNYNICLQRVRSLAKRLAQTPGMLQLYDGVIQDQVCRWFIERVDISITPNTGKVHYIPHHCVKKNSATTPIRVVYDCSCRQSRSDPSLNDCLSQCPDFLNNLCSILLRFHTHNFGVSTDIEKAFLHIYLHEQDRNFTRFFWLANPKDPHSDLQVYRFRTVLFGAVSSPFILYATLYHHLQQYNTPLSQDIQQNLYVDNVISGGKTEAEAVQYYHEARTILSKAGFNLRAWASNSQQLCTIAMQHNTADSNIPTNVLGLHWNTLTDQIFLIPKRTALSTRNLNLTTKREVLQESSKTFDPIGFTVPVTIRSKLLMQRLWQMHVEWDEPLETDLNREWQEILKDLHNLPSVSINRRYTSTTSDPTQVELHAYTDASTKAYGAVTFCNSGGCISFIMAKCRVAPLKITTLPRLELMAAVIRVRITHFVMTSLELTSIPIHLWTDSQIVMYWIHSTKHLPPFVAHCIGEIHRLVPTASWHYCPTNDNPADLLTRGLSFDQFASSQFWRHGPPWLPHKDKWPKWEHSPAFYLCSSWNS